MSYDVQWGRVERFAEASDGSDERLRRGREEMPPAEGQTSEELAYQVGVHDVMGCLPPELQEWLVTQVLGRDGDG